MQLNPLMSLLPCLIVEQSAAACTICQTIVPSAKVVVADFAGFYDMLRLGTLSPGNLPPQPLCPVRDTVIPFITARHGIAGIDLHAPHSSSTTLSRHWLGVALRIIDSLSQSTQLRCFLLTIPLHEAEERLNDQLSLLMVGYFHDRKN